MSSARFRALVLVFCLVMAPGADDVLAETAGPAWTLIADGRAQGVIYVAADATPTAMYAAEELRDHLKMATGVELAIVRDMPADEATPVVLVGPSDETARLGVAAADLPLETYRIHTGANRLVLAGGDQATDPFENEQMLRKCHTLALGTLQAVYRFLEDVVGIRWYMPGNLGTIVPPTGRVDVPALDIRAAPSTEFRMFQFVPRSDDPAMQPPDSDIGRWFMRLRLGRPRRYTFNHTFLMFNESHEHNWWTAARAYVRENQLYTTKPHIYALLPDGRRDFDITSYGAGNLCLSEPDTVTEFVNIARRRFDANPDLVEFSVNPNDVWVPCFCDTCLGQIPDAELRERIRREAGANTERGTARLSLSPELMSAFRAASGRLLARFHVNVARELYKSHPDRLVGTFGGYERYGRASNYEKLGPLPPNLAVQFTKTRAMFWDREYLRNFQEEVKAWRRITPNIYVWEYYLWNWRPWRGRPVIRGYPVFFPTLLEDDMQFMHAMGLKGEYTTPSYLGIREPGLSHIMPYVTARMLWDKDVSVWELLEEYYTLFYGAARDEMKAFWKHAETCWMRDTRGLDARAESDKIIETLFTLDDLRFLFERLDAAQAMLEPGTPEYRRVALIAGEMETSRARLGEVNVSWGTWRLRKDPDNRGVDERWFEASAFNDADWREVKVPAFLSQTAIGSVLGYSWYATTFTMPETLRGGDLELLFGAVDEQAWVYVNGQLVGEHTTDSTGLGIRALWDSAFDVGVPSALLHPSGVNRLVVRMHNAQGDSGIHKAVRVCVKDADRWTPPRFQSAAIFPAPPLDPAYHEGWNPAAIRLSGRDGGLAEPSTEIRLAHDPEHLYLTFRAAEDGSAPLPSDVDGKGWWWRGVGGRVLPRGASNTMMIEIQPDPAVDRYAAVLVNAGGGHVDLLYGDAHVTDPGRWESGARVSVVIGEDAWTGTVAIPWASLGVRLHPGLVLHANITRVRPGQPDTAWSPLPAHWSAEAAAARGRERFGILHFLEE